MTFFSEVYQITVSSFNFINVKGYTSNSLVTMKLVRNGSAHGIIGGLSEIMPGGTEEKLQKLSIRLGVV